MEFTENSGKDESCPLARRSPTSFPQVSARSITLALSQKLWTLALAAFLHWIDQSGRRRGSSTASRLVPRSSDRPLTHNVD